MNKAEVERLVRQYLLPGMPGFGFDGSMLYARPVGYILQAMVFRPWHSRVDDFELWSAAIPLFVPAEGVCALPGFCLRSMGWDWSRATEAEVMLEVRQFVRAECLPQLARDRDPRTMIRHRYRAVPYTSLLSFLWRKSDFVSEGEYAAYAFILDGDFKTARRLLGYLVRQLEKDIESPRDRDVLDRTRQVLAALDRSPGEAKAVLDGWREQSLRTIGLESEISQQPDDAEHHV